jgi:O-antigen/teichoic acid export membrane protein
MGTKTTASYAFSVQMVAGLSVLSSAIAGGLLPHIAQGLAARDSAAVERTVIRYVRFTSMLATVGYIGIAVLAPLIALHFGGRGYSGTLPLILILGAGQVLSTAAGLSGSVLTVARQYLVTTIITVGVAIYAVALEAASAYGLHQLILVAVVSGSSTVLLPMINNVALARILGIRTDFLARVGS